MYGRTLYKQACTLRLSCLLVLVSTDWVDLRAVTFTLILLWEMALAQCHTLWYTKSTIFKTLANFQFFSLLLCWTTFYHLLWLLFIVQSNNKSMKYLVIYSQNQIKLIINSIKNKIFVIKGLFTANSIYACLRQRYKY